MTAIPPTKNILFISYDGMTDSLGQSQVLPYVIGLAQSKHYHMTLLSCEKHHNFEKYNKEIKDLCTANGIDWHYTFFHQSPPIASKYYDMFLLRRKAISLIKRKQIDALHCRGHVPMFFSTKIKKKFNLKLIFDFRGYWVDERVDAGLWDLRYFPYRFAFQYYKRREANFIRESESIVVLTNRAKQDILSWPTYDGKRPIDVIPCVADFNHFSLVTEEKRSHAKAILQIPDHSFTLSYLGSVGTWYLLKEMLLFYKALLRKNSDVYFLFLTHSNPNIITTQCNLLGIDYSRIIIRYASRNEIPILAAASNCSISFIKPSYSKIGSSPTKLGELFAMGIPVICNSNVGDVENIVESMKGGLVLDALDEQSFHQAIEQIEFISSLGGKKLRDNADQYYNLQNGIEKYCTLYSRLFRANSLITSQGLK
ncbi:MAG: glycosyltransferase [Oligoflexia bacterium]|nr:glycosyltransferase [Oligoflexia bacterium]